MPRTARDVVFVDGVRTPFGKAGPTGLYAETRADDMVVSVIRELLRRNPGLPPETSMPEDIGPNEPGLEPSGITTLFPGEVVTRTIVRDVELPYGAGTMASSSRCTARTGRSPRA